MKSFTVLICLITSFCLASHRPSIRVLDGGIGAAKTPLLTIRNYTYSVVKKELGVRLQLGKEDAKKLSEITRHYLGRQLCFVVGESTITFPKVRDVLKGDGIWLTLRDGQELQALETALKGDGNQR